MNSKDIAMLLIFGAKTSIRCMIWLGICLWLLALESGNMRVSAASDSSIFGTNLTYENASKNHRKHFMKRGVKFARSFLGGFQGSDEVHFTAPELIRNRGFNVEIHKIETEDGYILEAHRIPGAPGAPVVFGFHGMLQSSRDLLMNSGHKAFAYKMADAGYDVWLGNARGNFYSRKHKFLSPDTAQFWDYSVDDIIYFDIPASIDYVLQVTGSSKLNWVGYSLGSAVIFGCLSTRPEYNDKVEVLVSMGTTAYVGNAKSPPIRLLAPFANLQDKLVTALNHGEYLPQFLFPIMRKLLPIMCSPEAKKGIVGLCSHFLFLVAGINYRQANPAIVPVLLGGTPSSVSVKMLSQWYQWINKGRFTYYDHGRQGNLDHYGQTTPPIYDLTRVTAKTINIWSENDWLSVPKDVARTVADLPNVVANVRVEMASFNHLDFIYGKDADVLVYDKIIQLLRIYN